MNKLFLLLGILFLSVNTASAKLKIPVGEVDKLDIVADLPNTEEYSISSKRHLNLAQFYKEYVVAWVPVWITEEPKLVLAESQDANEYYELTEEELNDILTANELDKDDLLSLGFFKRFGGKIIFILIILGGWLIYAKFG